MNSLVEEMQVYYGRGAPVYDAAMGYDVAETRDRLAPVIDLLADLMRGRRVLELACGPCFWTGLVSTTAASILATDFNQSTLDLARRKPLAREKVSLRVADAYDLRSIPGPFDGVFAVDWFAHVPRSRIHAFLDGLHAKLEPGSQVAFCDELPGPRSLTGVFDEEGNHIQERTLPDGSRYRVIKHFLTDAEITALFAAHSERVEVSRFPQCRRLVVSYTWRGGQADGAEP